MRGPSASNMRWLLISDLHFNHRDLDRVQKTAQWIVAEAERQKVGRAVVCGDLLTSRTMQQTHVLSACYRFIGRLSDVVPRVSIVLGNHDLAYRRDFQTTALDALNISHLAPYVSLHSKVASDEWDGRRVLLLPFREEQSELTEAVAALDPKEASETVAFAHLAINKAITQRYVVENRGDKQKPGATNSITYRGLTGPDAFSSLARTFTGHFHSYQTILQKQSGRTSNDKLHGSITYLGSPLQLNWADLYDEQRGIVLFDPETLEHELLINPHAVDYITADLRQVLEGQINENAVVGKHVMLVGELSNLKYVKARDRLLSLGVRGVRDWNPMGFTLHTDRPSFSGLGASVPESDVVVQPLEPARGKKGVNATSDTVSGSEVDTGPQTSRPDLAAEARRYVELRDLDSSLLLRKNELVRVGQRMIQASNEMGDQDGQPEVNYRDFLDGSCQGVDTRTSAKLTVMRPSTHVFVAEPRTLIITNFLGVQGTITIDFRQNLRRGLTFLIGENRAGKSTLVEAMAWCQFGQCIRSGMVANDVVNDTVGKNCSVVLEFANGYSIARHRKHKIHGNRVIISLHGEPQPQLEHPKASTTQAAIDELLGTDYETYVRTVVLGHESSPSFLNSSPTQRRDLIETSLGLSMLDQCGQLSRLLLKEVDKDMDDVKGKMEGLLRTMEHVEGRLKNLDGAKKKLEKEAMESIRSLGAAMKEHVNAKLQIDRQKDSVSEESTQPGQGFIEMKTTVADGEQKVLDASRELQGFLNLHQPGELSKGLRAGISTLQNQIQLKQQDLQLMEKSYAQIQSQVQAEAQKHAEPTSWLGRLQKQLDSRLKTMSAVHPMGLRRFIHALKVYNLRFRLMAVRGLMRVLAISREDYQEKENDMTAQVEDQETAINALREDINNSNSRLQSLKNEESRFAELEKLAADHAAMLREAVMQKEAAMKKEAAMIKKAAMMRQRLEQTQKACEALQQQVTIQQHDAATHKRLVENEQSSLNSLRSEKDGLVSKLENLAVDRELFDFWSSALAKRSRRASSSNSTFREHILAKSLPELNTLLAQILTVLFNDKQNARIMATGVLRSVLDSDSDTSSGSVLDQTLAVNRSLSYGKRSGGERKRIDLAVFFALLQLSWARSAYRAQYMLVDEVFDSLDQAGQAAVVKMCEVMCQMGVVGWIVVITHSRFLAERDVVDEDEEGRVMVMQAKRGKGGTELYIDGRRVGV